MNCGKQSVGVMWCWIAEKRWSCFCFQTWAASDSFFVCRFLGNDNKETFFKTTQRHQVVSSQAFWQSQNGQFTPKSKPRIFPLTWHTLRCCLPVQPPRKAGGGSLNKLNQTCCANYPMISAFFQKMVKWADITAQLDVTNDSSSLSGWMLLSVL